MLMLRLELEKLGGIYFSRLAGGLCSLEVEYGSQEKYGGELMAAYPYVPLPQSWNVIGSY